MRVHPLLPGRVRAPRGAYGWVDLRAVTCGWLRGLGPKAALTYLFLCTVANMQGVSFWGRQRIAERLALEPGDVDAAVAVLESAELIAVKGRVVQVLPLPQRGPDALAPQPKAGAAQSDPVAASNTSSSASPDEPLDEATISAWEPEARRRIARALGVQHESSVGVVRALATSLARKAALGAVSTTPKRGEARG